MPRARALEPKELDHALKVTAVSSANAIRNIALLLTAHGTALTAGELAQLMIPDVLNADGSYRLTSEVRAEIAFNGKSRPLIWENQRVQKALDDYFEYRRKKGLRITTNVAAYRGLDPTGPVFLGRGHEGFTLTRRQKGGKVYFGADSCASLLGVLYKKAGLYGATSMTPRRSFAVQAYRRNKGCLRELHEILGYAEYETTLSMCEGDPMRLGAIVAKVL